MDIDVPENSVYPPPGIDERTFTPGPEMFGLIIPSWPGPRDEKSAITWLMSYAPFE